MSQSELLTVHPDPELEASSWDDDLESIEDFAKDRYGLSENPYVDAPSVHGEFQRSYREGDGSAHNAIAVDHRTGKDTETVINVLLNRTSAEYVTKIQSSDHEWDAQGWVNERDGRDLETHTYFGQPDEEGRDVKREIQCDFDIEPHIPFFY